MHGGFPLDCETVISEAYALKMAEACDGLVLTGLPYFYAGATGSGAAGAVVGSEEGFTTGGLSAFLYSFSEVSGFAFCGSAGTVSSCTSLVDLARSLRSRQGSRRSTSPFFSLAAVMGAFLP